MTNTDHYIIPGKYKETTSLLFLSNELEPIKIFKFHQQSFLPKSVSQYGTSKDYLIVSNHKLIKFSLISSDYKVLTL